MHYFSFIFSQPGQDTSHGSESSVSSNIDEAVKHLKEVTRLVAASKNRELLVPPEKDEERLSPDQLPGLLDSLKQLVIQRQRIRNTEKESERNLNEGLMSVDAKSEEKESDESLNDGLKSIDAKSEDKNARRK
ncbi:hypothetical protein SNE40_002308 [Patella caerulea]|uniref:Uncharacterized protein n=1 Tax=Patella caerulea TaxID=87958 RepID=A0AAN8KBJ5_PATCE